MGELPCTEAGIRRARVAEIASAVVNGRTGIIQGARELSRLRLDVDPGEEDEELLGMAGIESQTDHLAPAGKHPAWAEHEAFFRDAAMRLCATIAARYATHED